MLRCNSDDVVLALADAPIDPRTGNKVLYSANWSATNDSMIGEINEDWVRRELAWFNSGSDHLDDMEGPVPTLFQQCAGDDGRVNSAYGHILFTGMGTTSLYARVLTSFLLEGSATRHAVAIISDRDVHELARLNNRNDFICTNALNFMIDSDGYLHIIAQMRSMDAVFGYRADYSMWDEVMKSLLIDLNTNGNLGMIRRGRITFQVANLHVYPRHFDLLAAWSEKIYDRMDAEARHQWFQTVAADAKLHTGARPDMVLESDPHVDQLLEDVANAGNKS